jgi:hypothetical protein
MEGAQVSGNAHGPKPGLLLQLANAGHVVNARDGDVCPSAQSPKCDSNFLNMLLRLPHNFMCRYPPVSCSNSPPTTASSMRRKAGERPTNNSFSSLFVDSDNRSV